ncbi:hypothetical protein AUK04_03805 [Candidatus Roizmanbacteria bacterium CG2_30_33_16]|uniref:Uncharacterized protein n=4 Tax=Candidatus Roizmaniibacteriota TaxID=1752723 RepID=A0A2H0C4P6_9BACT|nr:MAG: hypothetical protein AUK04_03805 [Candidatus Roizmanbacteria bacterium CG2_30_33_16]PIP64884.1 MAG: hypothetical protein COW96_00080 [Candidatus Roizmanbacteria bacterium CG22_combo_CG10-13_8_21_14_all_33_16]PIX69821.1 MAG: hypothetical protein COZ39_05030 [Candidatus Roizmanbacteria bacterium CG_4_10_14_3_um_filter_33_21]
MNFVTWLFTNTPLKFFVQSFWRDEAFTYLLSIKSIPVITNLTAQDFNPPLYYWLMHFWIKLFGKSEIILRLPSLIFFCATVYIAYLILIEVFKINWKIVFVLLIAFILNPSLHYYAFETRMYSMMVFFITLSYYALFKKQWRLYTFTVIFGLYTHYFAFFAIVAQLTGEWLVKKDYKIMRELFHRIVYIALIYLPWIVYLVISHDLPPQSFWITSPNLSTWINLPTIIYSGFERELNLKVSLWLFNIVMSSFILMNLIIFRKKAIIKKNSLTEQSIITHLCLWTFLSPLILLIISFFYPIFLPRYFLYCTVGLLLLIIKLTNHSPKLLTLVLLIVSIISTNQYIHQQVTIRTKFNLRKTITSIKKISRPSDLLFVDHEFNYHVAQYYFPANRVFILGKTYEEIPVYVGKILIPKSAIATQIPIYPDRAFLLKESGEYSIISQE